MKPGQSSRTAEWVCMARAMAHGRTPVAEFSDPTALALLPDDARSKVERMRADRPSGPRERAERAILRAREGMMVARTVEIDRAVRERPGPQVVILGAGLDGRAYRMAELSESIVFEVDHPDTQREKRLRAESLAQTAREVRFVPVDFTRDSLDAALASAGHEAGLATTWIWEGVVMYLTAEDVAATLAVVARRSASGSRIVVAYLTRTFMMYLAGLLVRRVGEPFRSWFEPSAMRRLLAEHGFSVVRDENVLAIARALSPELARTTRALTHLRIATADRTDRT